jgi:dipeptidyl aminopeptidase/acylaminoacyl peptidase
VVDLDGDTLIAATEDQQADDDAVYIFQRSGATWAQQVRLTGANPSYNFGAAVAVAGDVALVGDPGTEFSLAPENKGVVTVYTRSGDTWSAAGSLSPDDGEPGDGFGCAMDFDGQTAVIAACSTLQLGVPTRAYVFTLDGGVWTQAARLDPAPDAMAFDLSSVDYDGDRILLGAVERFYSLATYSGAAFLFERDGETWRQTQTLRPDDVEPTDGYVWDAALAGDEAVVSAIFKNRLNAAQRGAVYVFSPRPEGSGLVYLPAAAGPEFPAGPIAFAAYAGYGEDTELYLVWPDGRGRTQLTHSPSTVSEFFPAWSPDGARLAFTRETPGELELVVLELATGTETIIPTPGANAIHRPAWSPDGQTIAYDGLIGASYDVYAVAADGSSDPVNLTQTSQADESYPAWSPDGSRIAFLNVTTLATMKPDGSDVTPIPGSPAGAFSPDWSPDGTTILFHVLNDGDPALYTIPAGGGAPTLVIADAENGRWSPDGSGIVFTGAGGGLFTVNPDGAGLAVVFGSKFALMPDWRP